MNYKRQTQSLDQSSPFHRIWREKGGIPFFSFAPEIRKIIYTTNAIESLHSRFIVIGKIADKHWSGVITYRKGKIRIVSVRHARSEEVKLYEGESE